MFTSRTIRQHSSNNRATIIDEDDDDTMMLSFSNQFIDETIPRREVTTKKMKLKCSDRDIETGGSSDNNTNNSKTVVNNNTNNATLITSTTSNDHHHGSTSSLTKLLRVTSTNSINNPYHGSTSSLAKLYHGSTSSLTKLLTTTTATNNSTNNPYHGSTTSPLKKFGSTSSLTKFGSTSSLTKLAAAAATNSSDTPSICEVFRKRIINTIVIPLLLLLPLSSYFYWHHILMTTSLFFSEIDGNDILGMADTNYIFGFHPEWHPVTREERFPNTTERIKLYMSNFYLPPCVGDNNNNSNSSLRMVDERVQYSYIFNDDDDKYPMVNLSRYYSFSNQKIPFTMNITTRIFHDMPLALWEDAIKSPCSYPHFENNYCGDLRKMASMALEISGMKTLSEIPPIIAQLGDRLESDFHHENVPIILKFRPAASADALAKVTNPETGLNCHAGGERQKLATLLSSTTTTTSTDPLEFSPIIWPLNYYRHYGGISINQWFDSPWEWKKNRAVWRGLLTGLLSEEEKQKSNTFSEECEYVPRCRFVRQQIDKNFSRSVDHTLLLDVGVSYQLDEFPIDNAHLYYIKGGMSKFSQLQYKAIIMMEGNDISTGLKWALYSRSVVLMPPPTKTSFLMEELLQPYVHYVPLQPDLSDASQQMQWIIDHDLEARRIAERATLWINDLLYHEHSSEENQYIQEQILQRQMQFFIPVK